MRRSPTARSATEHLVALLLLGGAARGAAVRPVRHAVSQTEVIEAAVGAAYAVNGGQDPPNNGQFSSKRYAFLFKPGAYSTDVPVGFYTQVLGLGASPDDVTFNGERGVYCQEGDFAFDTGALDTFWRSAENFHSQASWARAEGNGMLWAVSQATPLRRLRVNHDLILFEYEPPATAAGYSSGGYFSSLSVGGDVQSGSQQQWFARSSRVGAWSNAAWNAVLAGVEGAPPSHCGNDGGSPYTVLDQLQVTSEKPYIRTSGTDDDTFELVIPAVLTGSAGPDWDGGSGNVIRSERVADFSGVYLAQPGDSAAAINAKLRAGLHVVLSPAIYRLEAPLEVCTPSQVVLGLGLATLVPTNATAAVSFCGGGGAAGARLAGVLVQAGARVGGRASPTLVHWQGGDHDQGAANAANASEAGFMHDVFARVGGPDGSVATPVAAEVMVRVDASNVIGDNLWLWRADHIDPGAGSCCSNDCAHGLLVSGDDVTMYGLAVEHTQRELTQWAGERGTTVFYQSELPYEVDASQWPSDWTGYRVNETVEAHNAYGVGVYTFFRDHEVTVDTAIRAPDGVVGSFVAPLAVKLNGNGGANHVLNALGDPVLQTTDISYVCAASSAEDEPQRPRAAAAAVSAALRVNTKRPYARRAGVARA